MKKDLMELNRKIRHSRKKHDNLIRRRNNLTKAIDEMVKARHPTNEVAHKFEFKRLTEAFGRAYRSYRVEGMPKMDPDTFYGLIKEGLIGLIKREIKDLQSVRIQTTTWIRFRKGPMGPTSGNDEEVELAFNSKMMDFFKGSYFKQLINME